MMTPTDIYALRTTNLLPVPPNVLDIIMSMQLAPVAQVYHKKTTFKKAPHAACDRASTWRSDVMISMKKLEFKHDDPDYNTIVGITNKVSAASLSSSANSIIDIMKLHKDDEFRLRIVTLMFDRGVSMPFYAKLMANMFELIYAKIPEIREDLQFSCSLESFHRMFEHADTVTCPDFEDPEYDEKLCKWAKKREIRRGFGMFATELHVRGLIDEEVIVGAIKVASDELEDIVRKHSDKLLSETVDQLVTLLYDTCKILITQFGKEHPTVKMIVDHSKRICAIPRSETQCMGMRSRFKLEDILKL